MGIELQLPIIGEYWPGGFSGSEETACQYAGHERRCRQQGGTPWRTARNARLNLAGMILRFGKPELFLDTRLLEGGQLDFGLATRGRSGGSFPFDDQTLRGDSLRILFGGKSGQREGFCGLVGVDALLTGAQGGLLRRRLFLFEREDFRLPLCPGGRGGGEIGQCLLLALRFGAGMLFGFQPRAQRGFGGLFGSRLLDGETAYLRFIGGTGIGLFGGKAFGLGASLSGSQQMLQFMLAPRRGVKRKIVGASAGKRIGLRGKMIVQGLCGTHLKRLT